MISSLKSKFRACARRALLVSSDKLAVYHWMYNSLGSSYLFDASKEGFDFFGRYLSEVRNDPVYVLLDTSAEEYLLDTIPHASGVDRKALIERKQNRAFRGTPYLYMEIQGRKELGRRDDRIMLSAITNPAVIQPWLKILEKHKVPVVAVISVPLLLQERNGIIPNRTGNTLIFSLQSISGLRQSFFMDKSLKFSRLVKMPRYGAEPYAPILAEELIKVRRYIKGARLMKENEILDVYFFGNKELLADLGETHVDSPTTRYHLLDVEVLSEKCGFVEQVKTPFSDKYFIYQLLKHKCKNYYAVSKETRYFQMLRINELLRIASFLFILCGISWGGWNVLEGVTYRQQLRDDAKRVDFYNARYEAAQEKISALPVNPADLKIAVDIENVLKTYKANPVDMFKLISNGLDIFPNIQISQIQWAANINPNYETGSRGSNNIAVEDIQRASNFSGVNNAETDFIYYQIALLNAYIEGFDGNYREAFKTINKFSEFIKNLDSVYDVSVIKLPLVVNSDASMQGSLKESAVKSDFSVRIVLGVRSDT